MMRKKESKSLSFFFTTKLSTKSNALIQIEKQTNSNHDQEKKLESPHVNANKIMLVKSDEETDEDWKIVGAKKIRKDSRN
jgi:hypothetical protein